MYGYVACLHVQEGGRLYEALCDSVHVGVSMCLIMKSGRGLCIYFMDFVNVILCVIYFWVCIDTARQLVYRQMDLA